MNLFDVLPNRYFLIFSSKNKKVYAESLLILFDMLSNDLSSINKADFIKALKDKGSKILDSFDAFADEDDFEVDDNIIIDTLSTKASFICEKLEEYGWISISMDTKTLEEIIILPAYTISILRAFKDIISDEESPYLSLVHSTYSELKLEDEESDDLMYITLIRCYENTRKLKIELVTLSNSIKMFKSKLTKLFQTNDVLVDFFDVYKTKILDRYYHPLKTFDSVIKFKRPIINILNKWLNNNDIRLKLVKLGSLTNTAMNPSDIENDIITKINYIIDTYTNISYSINQIDIENSEYTKSSTNKILYLNNTDKSIKGHLENIFKFYGKNLNNPRELAKILSKMQDSIYFYEQGYIDSDSFTFPILRKYKEEAVPLPIGDFEIDNNAILGDFLESFKNVYSNEKIYGFMERCFGDSDYLKVEDIPLISVEAFILLILATIKKDDADCFYEVDVLDNEKIRNNGYIVPHLLFRRKEKVNV